MNGERSTVNAAKADLVWSEVRDKLDEVSHRLPAGTLAPELEISSPVAVTLAVAISSEDLPLTLLTRIGHELKSRLSALPNTRETELFGEAEEEILVEVDPHALARLNISMPALSQLISASDTRLSAGKFESSDSSLVVEVRGELTICLRPA